MMRWGKAVLIYALLLLVPALTWATTVWQTKGSFYAKEMIVDSPHATGPSLTLCKVGNVVTPAWIQVASGAMFFHLDSARTATPTQLTGYWATAGDVLYVERPDKFWAMTRTATANERVSLMVSCTQ